MLRACSAPERLELKRAAQCILLKNLDSDRGLVNGARGVVVGFTPSLDKSCSHVLPTVEFCGNGSAPIRVDIEPEDWTVESGGRVLASRRQVCSLERGDVLRV